jgi:hypothetical protein
MRGDRNDEMGAAVAETAAPRPDADAQDARERRRALRAPLIALLARAVIDELHGDESGTGSTAWPDIVRFVLIAGSSILIAVAVGAAVGSLPPEPIGQAPWELLR